MVKRDTGRTLELTERQTAATTETAKSIEAESTRDQADTVPDTDTGPAGGLGGTAVLNVLKDIRDLLEEGAGDGEGKGNILDLLSKFAGKGKQEGRVCIQGSNPSVPRGWWCI